MKKLAIILSIFGAVSAHAGVPQELQALQQATEVALTELNTELSNIDTELSFLAAEILGVGGSGGGLSDRVTTLEDLINGDGAIPGVLADITALQLAVANIQLIPGPAGPQGLPGATGPQGPAGADGLDLSIEVASLEAAVLALQAQIDALAVSGGTTSYLTASNPYTIVPTLDPGEVLTIFSRTDETLGTDIYLDEANGIVVLQPGTYEVQAQITSWGFSENGSNPSQSARYAMFLDGAMVPGSAVNNVEAEGNSDTSSGIAISRIVTCAVAGCILDFRYQFGFTTNATFPADHSRLLIKRLN